MARWPWSDQPRPSSTASVESRASCTAVSVISRCNRRGSGPWRRSTQVPVPKLLTAPTTAEGASERGAHPQSARPQPLGRGLTGYPGRLQLGDPVSVGESASWLEGEFLSYGGCVWMVEFFKDLQGFVPGCAGAASVGSGQVGVSEVGERVTDVILEIESAE